MLQCPIFYLVIFLMIFVNLISLIWCGLIILNLHGLCVVQFMSLVFIHLLYEVVLEKVNFERIV